MSKQAINSIPIVILLLMASIGLGFAQSQEKPVDEFADQSLKLRTALFHDSAIGAPLDSLVKLYQQADREEELIAIYQAHLEEYPKDPKAKAVLIRILTKLGRGEVDKTVQLAAQQHPEFAHLQYLLSQNLRQKNINLSLEALSKAIDLETDKNRRSRWLGELLELSKTEKGRELATYQMKKLLQVEGQTGQTMLSLGKVMFQHQFWELSRTALLRAIPTTISAEQRLEASVLVAKAEASLGMKEVAGQRLDELLKKLSPEHQRRRELMSLRISVIATEEERNRILNKKRTAFLADKSNEIAILEYADLLVASGNRGEAIRIVKESSLSNPESAELEKRALSLIEAEPDRSMLVDFLTQKLENQESRTDLRYQLVKAHYQAGDIHSANQDWSVVLAALEAEPEKRAERILELARFLRSIKKSQAANQQYLEYLKLQPTRLDVTRELCEDYLNNGLNHEIKRVIANTSSKGASIENLLDLSQFLIDEQLFGSADQILSEYQSTAPIPSFEAGLALAVVKSELGQYQPANSSISELRKQTDTSARYKQWLGAALAVNDNFDSTAAFFEREQSRFAFAADEWTVDRIDNFLYLCETGEKRQLSEEVTKAVQARLLDDNIITDLRIKLRELLVKSLERKGDANNEIEEQLTILAKEDPDRIDDYKLRTALIQYKNDRHDLASITLSEVEIKNIGSAKLLRDSYPMLGEFGDSQLTDSALEMVTKLDPGDLFSWEKRLSLLAAEGKEEEFRSAIRNLLQGAAQKSTGAEWRSDSRQALQAHLIDSYWRSIAGILADEEGAIANCIPLLESVQREAKGESLLWVEWARALVFGKLNRNQEQRNAIEQLNNQLQRNPNQTLVFPDGLSTPLSEAIKQFDQKSKTVSEDLPTAILPLLDQPQMSWAFESDSNTTILQIGLSKDSIIALDNHGKVYRIDAANGKLIWKKTFRLPNTFATSNSIQKARQIIVTDQSFVLLFDDELIAYQTADGSTLWKAPLPLPHSIDKIALDSVNQQVIAFDSKSGLLNAFSSESGKLNWEKKLTQNNPSTKQSSNLTPLNTGLSVQDGKICAFGEFGSIIEARTGTLQWAFGAESVRSFPVLLREKREHLSDQEIVTLEQIKGTPEWGSPTEKDSAKAHLNYLSSKRNDDSQTMFFLKHPGSLMAPAVNWSQSRKQPGKIANAVNSKNGLWLMDQTGLQYISLELPIGARQFQVKGVWLGEKQGHAWVLDKDSLYHINANKNLVNIYPVNTLGNQVNGTMVGSWLYLRGTNAVAVYNVISGKQISGSLWPEEVTNYLTDVADYPIEAYTWQGYFKQLAPGAPPLCFPNNDLAAAGKFFTIFGKNRIVAISD